jgi:Gpi18-like mannosyltransferase
MSQLRLKKINMSLKDDNKTIVSTNTDTDYKKQVMHSKYIPESVKQFVLEKIAEMKLNNNDYYKQLMYVKTIINFPWSNPDDSHFFKNKLLHQSLSSYIADIEKKLNIIEKKA